MRATPDSFAPRPFHAPPLTPDAALAEVDACLDRITRFEPDIQALLPDEEDAERRHRIERECRGQLASNAAAVADAATAGRPLAGALVAVKDLFHVEGFPTRAGSRLPAALFEDRSAPGFPADGREAAVVTRLRRAGATVLGKSVSTEFAYFAPGPTGNPWNRAHTPGGSSSGSAAAVAAGFCHVALGTQTIGSIARPAAFCGVAGLKPSYGTLPVDGCVPFSPDADHVGLFAADWRSLRSIFGAIVADGDAESRPAAENAARRALEGTRLLVVDDAFTRRADRESHDALTALVATLRDAGVRIEPVALFDDIEVIAAAHQAMIARDFAEVHATWFYAAGDRYHERSAGLVDLGRRVGDDERERARAGRADVRERIEALLHAHRAVAFLAPGAVGAAPRGLDATGDPIMSLPWTYAGVPTATVPLWAMEGGRSGEGLPLAVQVAMPFGADRPLIDLAIAIEEVVRQSPTAAS